MARKSPAFPTRFALAALMLSAWRIYSRRARPRIPGHEELDDPEVSRAFDWVARLPQMRWARRYIARQALALKDRGEAVDLGCGPGYLVVLMAQMAPGLHMTGVDLASQMLELGHEAARQGGVEARTDFKAGDAARIPFPDGSLDLVVSTLSLHHWSDPGRVFAEIQRVLKPGGAYLIFDLRRDLTLPFYLLIWFATQVIVPAALHQINEPMGSRNASYTPEEVAALAKASPLASGQVVPGPLWLALQGRKA